MTYYNVTVQNRKDLREIRIYKYVKHIAFDKNSDVLTMFFGDGYVSTYNMNNWNVTAETIYIVK